MEVCNSDAVERLQVGAPLFATSPICHGLPIAWIGFGFPAGLGLLGFVPANGVVDKFSAAGKFEFLADIGAMDLNGFDAQM